MTTQPQSVPYPGYTNIAADLTALTANDNPNLPNGFQVYVVAERETYRLDTANPLTTSSPLIVARGATSGAGKWYRRSRAYVVGNFTLWACPLGGSTAGGGDSKIGGFTPGQITVSNANAPDIVLDLSGDFPTATATIYSAITDNFGNLWVAAFTSAVAFNVGAIRRYDLKNILASGSPTSTVAIVFNSPIGNLDGMQIAFDKQNSLWICYAGAGAANSALQQFGQSSYAVSGTPTPGVTLTVTSPGGLNPATGIMSNMTFDAEGNLWCALGVTAVSQGGILMFSASQLAVTNATILPSVFWSGSNFAGSGISSITGLAFGPTGLLWAASYGGNKIYAWDPRSPVSGNPAPAITLTSTQFNGPYSIVFDTGGNLWVCNDNDSHIYRIPAASLAASGAVTPDIILSQSTILAFPIQITFPNNPGLSGLLPSGVPIVK